MWRIHGLGDHQVKLLEVCRPTLLYCSIQGGKSTHPETGRHLHGLYVVDYGKIRPSVVGLGGEERDSSLKVEFDLNGPTHLNLPGTLYLTDGDPDQEYQVSASVYECPTFMPSWHALAARVTRGTYTIPSYHSRIRTAGAQVGFSLGALVGQLDHIPIPITGDNALFLRVADATIITEWWG